MYTTELQKIQGSRTVVVYTKGRGRTLNVDVRGEGRKVRHLEGALSRDVVVRKRALGREVC